ncbi:CRP protein, partial [Amia calva]|nr:CRP protein [Amia calva]
HLISTDLTKKAFYFPEESNKTYVTVTPETLPSLTATTVCLRYNSNLTRAQSLFSFATLAKANALLLLKNKPGKYSVYVNSKHTNFSVEDTRPASGWTQVCATWESSSGTVMMWVNGKSSSNQMETGQVIPLMNHSIVLGQEQDSFGGGFDRQQSLVGQITEVHMWDYVLSGCEITALNAGLSVTTGNVLNWNVLQYQRHGRVLLKNVEDTCK